MNRRTVNVYASWAPIEEPLLIGELKFSETSRGGGFSFAYDNAFLTSDYRLQVDPQLTLHRGEFYNDAPDKNFRAFLDSSPDRWGRILMQRRALRWEAQDQKHVLWTETTTFGLLSFLT